MRIGSGLFWCAVLLGGCAHVPPPKDYGKDIARLRQRVDSLETEVALIKATPKDDMPMPVNECDDAVDCD